MYKKYLYNLPHLWAMIIILLMTGIRFTFMGKGVYAFPDETRYEASLQMADCLVRGKVEEAFSFLLQTDARPGDCMIHVLPALIQYYLPHDQGVNHPDSLIVVQYFHLLIFVLLAWVFYNITTILFPEQKRYSLFALVSYLFIVNNHVYARHILPYDTALLFYLLVLWLVLHRHYYEGFISSKIKYIAGALTGFAWLVYPGYYWLPVLMTGYLFLSSNDKTWKDGFKTLYPFVFSALGIVVLVELIYRYYGASLIYGLASLSLGINQGDFSESLQFLFTYMKDTNGTMGWLFSLSFVTVGFLYAVRLVTKPQQSFDPLLVLLAFAFGAWLFHMLLGEVFQFMVFYGRLIHAFVPFMIWSLILIIKRFSVFSNVLMLLCIYGCLLSFIDFYQSYSSLTYPRDVLYTYSDYNEKGIYTQALELAKDKKEQDSYCNQHLPYAYYSLRDRRIDSSFYFQNTAILYPLEGQALDSCIKQSIPFVLDTPYYLSFIPYGYEGYSPLARKLLQSGAYRTRVSVEK